MQIKTVLFLALTLLISTFTAASAMDLLPGGEPCESHEVCESQICNPDTNICEEAIPGAVSTDMTVILENYKACESHSQCQSGYCAPTSASTKACQPKPTESAGGKQVADSYELPNFLFTDEPSDVVARVIKYLLGLVGVAAFVMFLYGGVQWMLSFGDPKKIDAGKDAMVWAVIGLAVIFSSFVIIKFILKLIGSSAGA